jgi:hypothetical protein
MTEVQKLLVKVASLKRRLEFEASEIQECLSTIDDGLAKNMIQHRLTQMVKAIDRELKEAPNY